jgi:hypothetical protein
MSHSAGSAGAAAAASPARPGEVGQVARLALLGLGTLATGMVGLVGMAAGYQVKKKSAPDPSKVTPMSYLKDLTHLVPPWQDPTTSPSASPASSSGSFRVASPGGMDARGFRDAEQEQLERQAEVDLWAAWDAAEEASLRFTFDPAAFSHVQTASRLFPLTAVHLHRVCSFLPYETVCMLTRVSRGFRDFCTVVLSRPNFSYQLARSRIGFSEQYRGEIWMRMSGARVLAVSMGQRASPTARDNFYEYQRRMCLGYRELIARQNLMPYVSRGSPSPQPDGASASASASASSAPALSAAAAAVDLSDLSEHARSSLDTVLKDVPRTLVPSNFASASLISNPSTGHEKGELMSATSPRGVQAQVLARDELIESLTSVLSVYSLHDTELGYCQGMNYVASFLLQKLPEQDAYWLLYKVMQDSAWRLRDFYLDDLKGLLFTKYAFTRLFRAYLPELHAHFMRQDVHSDIFTEWFMTFFTFSSFPRRYPLLDRIWDLLLAGRGLQYLFRVALSILYLAQQQLLEYEFESILFYMKHLPDEGILNPDILLPVANERFPVCHKTLHQLQQQYDVELAEEEHRALVEEEKRLKNKREAAAAKQRAEEQKAAALDALQNRESS